MTKERRERKEQWERVLAAMHRARQEFNRKAQPIRAARFVDELQVSTVFPARYKGTTSD